MTDSNVVCSNKVLWLDRRYLLEVLNSIFVVPIKDIDKALVHENLNTQVGVVLLLSHELLQLFIRLAAALLPHLIHNVEVLNGIVLAPHLQEGPAQPGSQIGVLRKLRY
eukprot:CAMPEP_0202978574 /NCGR_PEP_ID=MMETSP1396-20130829/84950_1 /ASSEMBLY_ACC=CAM_ASM_000872 /TAXON_ID= /ORGANISM="Pseudokeronopsis sp., Strain Brazil" /LENGTH=108 /DNA_ID=CAMNT_0049717583 /DNA_START=268 /DNA_END=594 /DNA_ORIENTATION=+